MHARRPRTIAVLATLLLAASVTAATLIAVRSASAREGARAPIVRSCDHQHPAECRRAVAYWRHQAAQARDAITWQRATRLRDVKRVNDQLVAPYAQAVAAARLAYAVCIAYLGRAHDCPPPSETLRIGRCESGLQTRDPNPASTADGPHQYLASTWAGAGFVAFARTEYLPSFLAIELYGANHHRTYSPWAASRYCHHLPL